MPRRAAVIGLDGAAWHLLDPLIEQGVLPRLAGIRARGASGVLTSTVPTYTPPAWTSAVTGTNPGRHGIYGFYGGNAQSERGELMHAGKIQTSTVWEIANAQGASVGIYHVPLTYPPQSVEGWMVSGMMTPGFGERLSGFATPSSLEDQIQRWTPGYVVDVSANWEQDWRDAALCERIVASLEQRKIVLERLLGLEPPDLLFAVLEAPDRLQHVYYRYMDPVDELYESNEGRALRPSITRCFKAMDDIVGIVEDFVEADGGIIVCSDHGFTAWQASVHTNTLLSDWGYLRLKPAARVMRWRASRGAAVLAKRFLPARFARRAKNATFSAIDWASTRAFASAIPQQGIYVNLEGRERFGTVPPSQLSTVKRDIAARFEALRAPDGAPATDRIWYSEEVFRGQALDGAPDLLPVMRGHRFELDDELFHTEAFTDVSHLPRGGHHPDGIVAVAGRGVASTRALSASVMDVTPSLLYMAGLAVPEDLDGEVMAAWGQPHLRDEPIRTMSPVSRRATTNDSPYSREEEAAIEESLRGLGYL